MADDKKEPWLNYLALTTVLLAVCATLSTFKGGGYSTRSLLSQTQASDQWAFYQAKSLKGYMYEMSRNTLQLELQAQGPKLPPDVRAAYEKNIEDYGKRIVTYDSDKKQIQTEAKKLEDARDDAKRHGQEFSIAVIFLQIAILLCSIAALMKKKPLWLLGGATGLVGVGYFINGFFLFF
jgi:Domain of unknown function (DUF4337)